MSSLQQKPNFLTIVPMRTELLLKLNMIFCKLFKHVNHNLHCDRESNHGKHFALKGLILPTLLFKLVKNEMAEVNLFEIPDNEKEYRTNVTINENLAAGVSDDG